MMKCDTIIQQLNMYFDGDLNEMDRKAVDDHLVECVSCRALYDMEKQLLQELKKLPVQGPSPDFNETVLSKAMIRAQKQTMRKTIYAGGMLAACLALWLAVWTPFSIEHPTEPAKIAQVALELNAPKRIKVLLTAPEDLQMASVTIRLSNNLEIQGYSDNREITWQTNIRKGKNYLTLPVIATKAGEATLVAEVNHQEKSKQFNLNMLVQKTRIDGKATYNRYTV